VKEQDKTLEIVEGIATRVLHDRGMTLDRVEMVRHPRQAVVRVFVEKEGGVGVDDCAAVSREMSAILDVEDPIDTPNLLEVSSPGLDRPLHGPTDFERFAGNRVRLHTRGPVEGRRQFRGILEGLADGMVSLQDEELGREVRVPLDQVAKARLDVEF
jgi:ribosome maturation factor RimP